MKVQLSLGSGGVREVEAHSAYGRWAVTPYEAAWSITHAPTGLGLASHALGTAEDMDKLARRLHATFPLFEPTPHDLRRLAGFLKR